MRPKSGRTSSMKPRETSEKKTTMATVVALNPDPFPFESVADRDHGAFLAKATACSDLAGQEVRRVVHRRQARREGPP